MKILRKTIVINLLFIGISCAYADLNYKKKGCPIPDIIMESITRKENAPKYPFYIRTNSEKTFDEFTKIVNKFPHQKTKDKMVIKCFEKENCKSIANILIKNRIENIDLGLHQINYKSFPDKNLDMYFNPNLSYYKACYVLIEKMKIKKTWNWKVIAGYHSFSKELNENYKKDLQEIFLEIAKERGYTIIPKEKKL